MSKKRSIKKKQWLIRKQKRIMHRLQRKNKGKKAVRQMQSQAEIQNKRRFFVSAPETLSLSENANETSKFFEEVFNVISKCKKGYMIHFDLTKINYVTADAIMYLIAIIKNSKRIKTLEIACGGNTPKNVEARNVFEKVGFYDYVRRTKSAKEIKSNDRIKIVRGKEADVITISSICDFVNEKIGSKNTLRTKRLYRMLVELMTNVKQHAYSENGNMSSRWYAYVENCEKKIQFVFLDTGVGIPSTIRKNWSEKIRDRITEFLGGDLDDSGYIEAALSGEFRTETEQKNRGKGLPEIKDSIMAGDSNLDDLIIVSGHGICTVNKNGIDRKQYIDTALEGALFRWCFEKEGTYD